MRLTLLASTAVALMPEVVHAQTSADVLYYYNLPITIPPIWNGGVNTTAQQLTPGTMSLTFNEVSTTSPPLSPPSTGPGSSMSFTGIASVPTVTVQSVTAAANSVVTFSPATTVDLPYNTSVTYNNNQPEVLAADVPVGANTMTFKGILNVVPFAPIMAPGLTATAESVGALPGSTITFSPAIPSGVTIPAGTQVIYSDQRVGWALAHHR